MARNNVEAFRRGLEAGNRGDVETLLEELDPGVEWHSALHALIGGGQTVFRGHDGVRRMIRDLNDAFTDFNVDITEIRDLGDGLLAIGRTRARGKASGAATETPIAYVTKIKNGKTVSIRGYLEPEEALEAAGLRDSSTAMTSRTIDLVRLNYEVINSIGRTGATFVDPEDFAPDLWAQLAPALELHERSDLPDAKVYRGRQAAKEFWRKTQELFSEIRWEPMTFDDLGRVVVVELRVVALGRGSNVPIEADETDVFWFRDGAITRIQAFPTKAEALEALQADG